MKHLHIRNLIKDAQRILGVEADGLPGPNTERALSELMADQINPAIQPASLITLLIEHLRQVDQPLIWVDHTKAAPKQQAVIHSPGRLAKPTEAPWLDWTLSHLGEAEIEGPASNPFIDMLWTIIGIKWTHTKDIDSKVSWCAALIGAALASTGYKHTGSGMARSYLKCGLKLSEFRRGCILIWPRGSDPAAGHVDLGIHLNDKGIVRKIGGNMGNKVAINTRPIKEALDMRWPVPA